jgi:hypothetical protein
VQLICLHFFLEILPCSSSNIRFFTRLQANKKKTITKNIKQSFFHD